MSSSFSNLLLTGVEVIGYGQYFTSPPFAMLLGDLGAAVSLTRCKV